MTTEPSEDEPTICSVCPQRSVVVVNGVRACVDHLDQVIGERLGGVREALADYYRQRETEITHMKE